MRVTGLRIPNCDVRFSEVRFSCSHQQQPDRSVCLFSDGARSKTIRFDCGLFCPVLLCSVKVHGESEDSFRSVHVDSRKAQSERAGSVGPLPELREVAGASEVHGCLHLPGARTGALRAVCGCELRQVYEQGTRFKSVHTINIKKIKLTQARFLVLRIGAFYTKFCITTPECLVFLYI